MAIRWVSYLIRRKHSFAGVGLVSPGDVTHTVRVKMIVDCPANSLTRYISYHDALSLVAFAMFHFPGGRYELRATSSARAHRERERERDWDGLWVRT